MTGNELPASPRRTAASVLLLGVWLSLGVLAGCTAPALKGLGPWHSESSQADEQIRQAALKDPFPNAGPRGY